MLVITERWKDVLFPCEPARRFAFMPNPEIFVLLK